LLDSCLPPSRERSRLVHPQVKEIPPTLVHLLPHLPQAALLLPRLLRRRRKRRRWS
jgi:hypothetical protein